MVSSSNLLVYNRSVFANNFKGLANDDHQTLPFEKGLFISNLNSSQFFPIDGQTGSPSISLAGVTIQMDGFLHTHSNALNQAPMFSPDDILLMTEVFIKGQAKDSNNLFFGIAHGYGPPYLMKVTNTTKFRKFAEKIRAMEKKEKKKDRFSDLYRTSFNKDDVTFNEKGFLDMLSREGAGNGLSLYRAENNDCKKWIKLERDNFSSSGISEIKCN
ncbi:MAG: hypothetical protein EOP00_31930 [Pedobacter sp.]|nr:MAG: hypothetical protein EOP00_31930 [Pedobacter sp.]